MAALDPNPTTDSVPSSEGTMPDLGLAADGQAIVTALSAEGGPGETSLLWENPESGSRGLITAYSGDVEEGRECLAFTTTRENFEGIGLYKGTACEDATGILRLRDMTSL